MRSNRTDGDAEEVADVPWRRTSRRNVRSVAIGIVRQTGQVIVEHRLNARLPILREELEKDPLTLLRAELAVVTFGGEVTVVQNFVSPGEFDLPVLRAGGKTPLGAAIHKGFDLIETRKRDYEARDLDHYRPWILTITDGEPTDLSEVLESARARVRAAELKEQVAFFAVGVEGANMEKLARLSLRPPRKLKELKFEELFQWVSVNLIRVSRSQLGERVRLTDPVQAGWAEV